MNGLLRMVISITFSSGVKRSCRQLYYYCVFMSLSRDCNGQYVISLIVYSLVSFSFHSLKLIIHRVVYNDETSNGEITGQTGCIHWLILCEKEREGERDVALQKSLQRSFSAACIDRDHRTIVASELRAVDKWRCVFLCHRIGFRIGHRRSLILIQWAYVLLDISTAQLNDHAAAITHSGRRGGRNFWRPLAWVCGGKTR